MLLIMLTILDAPTFFFTVYDCAAFILNFVSFSWFGKKIRNLVSVLIFSSFISFICS